MTVAEKWDYLLHPSVQTHLRVYALKRRAVWPNAWGLDDVTQEATAWASERWAHDDRSLPQTYARRLVVYGVLNACTYKDPDENSQWKRARRKVAAFSRDFERENGRKPKMSEVPADLFERVQQNRHLAMGKAVHTRIDWIGDLSPEPLRDMDAGAEIEEAVDSALLYARVCAALDTMPPENRHAIVEHIME